MKQNTIFLICFISLILATYRSEANFQNLNINKINMVSVSNYADDESSDEEETSLPGSDSNDEFEDIEAEPEF